MTEIVETGVSAIICCAHHDGRRWHGHTYEIKAWWPADGTDALDRQRQLDDVLTLYDHRGLGSNESTGEQLSTQIRSKLDGCTEVEINRYGERIFARCWRVR